jgi:hypothetical protein
MVVDAEELRFRYSLGEGRHKMPGSQGSDDGTNWDGSDDEAIGKPSVKKQVIGGTIDGDAPKPPTGADVEVVSTYPSGPGPGPGPGAFPK